MFLILFFLKVLLSAIMLAPYLSQVADLPIGCAVKQLEYDLNDFSITVVQV